MQSFSRLKNLSKESQNYGECMQCRRYNTSPAWCQTCDPSRTILGWTSGNKDIDDYIKNFQHKATRYDEVIEWILFDKLEYMHKISADNFEQNFFAVWMDGIRLISEVDGKCQQSRTPPFTVRLKAFRGSQKNPTDFLNKVEEYVQSANNFKLFGLTQNPSTYEYMIVLDEFYHTRSSDKGQCAQCKRYNTSPAWCQTCDPPRISQRWTSGNKDFDDYIKRLQLKTTRYDEAIEWIPYNNLGCIQKVRNDTQEISKYFCDFNQVFLAVWIDGIRLISEVDGKCIQSRTPPYTVSLINLADFSKKVEEYVQSANNCKLLGITQIPSTNEYMIVFDELYRIDKGQCSHCKRNNISPAWCQTCDPPRAAQGWTSENSNIDDYIKRLQLKATRYNEVIEWIPFNKLEYMQEITEKFYVFHKKNFSAVWIDGIRLISEVDGKCIQSRTPPYIVKLGTSFYSLNDFFEHYAEWTNKYKILGLTKNPSTSEYMIVFDVLYDRVSSKGQCAQCKKYNTSPAWCQTCDPPITIQAIQGWTSGSKDIDDYIKKSQLRATKYNDTIEWIPFSNLESIQKISGEVLNAQFLAIWIDGIRSVSNNDGNYINLRIPQSTVTLEIISSLQMNSIDFLKVDNYIRSYRNSKLFGFTQNPYTGEFMIVFDEFYHIRSSDKGQCAQCQRYNTSSAWCQTCDPPRISQGWTSGNREIDYYIKESQLKATTYGGSVEWISFNRLVNIQKISEDDLNTTIFVLWIDGIRVVLEDENGQYIRSCIPCVVALEPFPSSQINSGNFPQDLNKTFKLFGFTQNPSTTEYMIVYDKFYHKRSFNKGKCAQCKEYNTSPAWCQTCDPPKTTQGWTSESKDIDDYIKKFQLKATRYDEAIEWIPFNKLENIQRINGGDLNIKFSAVWIDGMRVASNEGVKSRTLPCTVTLNTFSSLQINSVDFLDEVEVYVQSIDKHKLFGLTQNPFTYEYMIVFAEFHHKRSPHNGRCSYCNQYNTSPAWCQTCDPPRTTQGWTSGNNVIDDYIKRLRLKTIKYDEIIEWIPFNKLKNIRKISEGLNTFLSVWTDGIRLVSNNDGKYIKSRTPPYTVTLKTFSDLNLVDFLEEVEEYVQSTNGYHKLFGLTQDTYTNEYTIIFDEFHHKRSSNKGQCEKCVRYNTSLDWCQTCDPARIIQSRNNDFDSYIKNFQLKHNATFEWIPFNKLEKVRTIDERDLDTEFLAVWIDGIEFVPNDDRKSHASRCIVTLKTFSSLQINSTNFLEKIEEYVRSSNYKFFGLTQNPSTLEYMIVYDDKYILKRDSNYGKCTYCKRFNTSKAWCQSCDPWKTSKGWTSENKDIDNCIKEFQYEATEYEKVIEWIPFVRLNNVQEIAKGGFGHVFSATWLDGRRKVIHNGEKYIQSRAEPNKIALKTLPGSQTSSTEFLREFKNHMKCRLTGSKLEIYGLTQNNITNQYLMVFQYVNSGNLHHYLKINFKKLTWKDKLLRLTDISKDLIQIHEAGYIHCDFHSGNILQHEEELWLKKVIKSYIADLGLSRNNKESTLKKGICGVMPFIAPEILLGKGYTKAADIYGFGVVMTEITTGIPPFDGYLFDNDLAIKICGGLRPNFAPGTPDFYIELAESCMNSDPQKRPTAKVLYNKVSE